MLHSFCFLNVRLFFAINSIIFDCKIKLWSDQKKKKIILKGLIQEFILILHPACQTLLILPPILGELQCKAVKDDLLAGLYFPFLDPASSGERSSDLMQFACCKTLLTNFAAMLTFLARAHLNREVELTASRPCFVCSQAAGGRL